MAIELGRLKRMERIRRLSAAQARAELELATAQVRQAETLLAAQARAGALSRSQARSALGAADRGEWLLAEAAGEVAGWNMARLQTTLAERRQALQPARESYAARHRDEEQISMLVGSSEALVRQEQGRREQAAADDWFSRKRQGRAGNREEQGTGIRD